MTGGGSRITDRRRTQTLLPIRARPGLREQSPNIMPPGHAYPFWHEAYRCYAKSIWLVP